MTWFLGFLCIGLILGISGVLAYYASGWSRSWRESQERLEEEGTIAMGWIVFANDNLYKRNPPGNCWNGQVVFTLKPIPNREETLERLANEIRHFESENDEDEEERIIGQIVKTEIGYHHPLRLPRRIAGNLEAYTTTFLFETDYFPESRLTLPYVYCKVILDEEVSRRYAMHIPYPRPKRKAGGLPVARAIRADGTVAEATEMEFPPAKIQQDQTTKVALGAIAVGAFLSIGLVLIVMLVMAPRRELDQANAANGPQEQPVPMRPNPPIPVPQPKPVVPQPKPKDPPIPEPKPPASTWPGKPPATQPGLPRGWKETEALGGFMGRDSTFREYRAGGAMLIGFEIGLGETLGTEIITYLRPIYRTPTGEEFGNEYGARPAKTRTVKAKDGYALGGVVVAGGGALEGLGFTYMKVSSTKTLVPDDWYVSDWIGEPRRKPDEKGMRAGDGSLVVGLHGSRFPDKEKTNFANSGGVCRIGFILVPPGVSPVVPKGRPFPAP